MGDHTNSELTAGNGGAGPKSRLILKAGDRYYGDQDGDPFPSAHWPGSVYVVRVPVSGEIELIYTDGEAGYMEVPVFGLTRIKVDAWVRRRFWSPLKEAGGAV